MIKTVSGFCDVCKNLISCKAVCKRVENYLKEEPTYLRPALASQILGRIDKTGLEDAENDDLGKNNDLDILFYSKRNPERIDDTRRGTPGTLAQVFLPCLNYTLEDYSIPCLNDRENKIRWYYECEGLIHKEIAQRLRINHQVVVKTYSRLKDKMRASGYGNLIRVTIPTENWFSEHKGLWDKDQKNGPVKQYSEKEIREYEKRYPQSTREELQNLALFDRINEKTFEWEYEILKSKEKEFPAMGFTSIWFRDAWMTLSQKKARYPYRRKVRVRFEETTKDDFKYIVLNDRYDYFGKAYGGAWIEKKPFFRAIFLKRAKFKNA